MREVLSFIILFTEPICIIGALIAFIFSRVLPKRRRKTASFWMHFFLWFMMIQAVLVIVMGMVMTAKRGGA